MRTKLSAAGMSVLLGLAGTVPAAAESVIDQPQLAAAASVPAQGTVAITPASQALLEANRLRDQPFARNGDLLWTAVGEVTAFDSSGKFVGAVAGIDRALGVVAAPDGSRVYSWSAHLSEIAVLDPATRTVVERRSTDDGPPTSVAVSADGKFLFYTDDSHWLRRQNLDTGEDAAVTRLENWSTLHQAGGTLVARNDRWLTAYRVVDGRPLELASRELRTWQVAVSPDGQELLAIVDPADGSLETAERLTTSDLVTRHTLTTDGNFDSLAWAPNGTSYAVGVATAKLGDVVRVYSAATNTLVARSSWPTDHLLDYQSVQYVSFSPTAPLLQGFAFDQPYVKDRGDGPVLTRSWFFTASTLPGFSAAASLTRIQPTVYGRPLQATFTAPGCAPCAVRFTLKDGVAGTRTFTRTVNSRIDLSLAVKGNGSLTASIPASLRRRAVQRSVSYQVPLLMKLRMTGKYQKKNNVYLYSKRPTLRVAVGPARRVKVVETIQIRVNGRWKNTMAWEYKTSTSGVLTVRHREPRDGRIFRLKYTFYPDGKNAAAYVLSPKVRWR